MRLILNIPVQKPPGMPVEEWMTTVLSVIVEAAREDAAIDSANAFTIDHDSYTELETFDPDTATTAEVGRALATLIKYLQSQGPRKDG